jgi:hypothetical protein
MRRSIRTVAPGGVHGTAALTHGGAFTLLSDKCCKPRTVPERFEARRKCCNRHRAPALPGHSLATRRLLIIDQCGNDPMIGV